MCRQYSKEIYLLGALTLISLISIVVGIFFNSVFSSPFYIGITLLLICFALFFWNIKYHRYFFGLSLILGTFSLIFFVPFQAGFKFSMLKTQIVDIQFIPAIFLILFAYKYRSRILDIIQNSASKTEEEKRNDTQSKIEKFRKDFMDLSDTEIENRLKYNLTSEARKVLLEIRSGRNS